MPSVLQVSGVKRIVHTLHFPSIHDNLKPPFDNFFFCFANTNINFRTSAFTSYGAFWMSYATILIPGSGVLSAFKDPSELDSALGIYLIAWFMVTFLLLWVRCFCKMVGIKIIFSSVASLRKNVGLVVLFAFLATTFLLLAAGTFTGTASFVYFNLRWIFWSWLACVEYPSLAVS